MIYKQNTTDKNRKSKEEKNMKELMKEFANEESGQGLVEYALIIVLIAVVAIAALTAVGGKVDGIFDAIDENLTVKE